MDTNNLWEAVVQWCQMFLIIKAKMMWKTRNDRVGLRKQRGVFLLQSDMDSSFFGSLSHLISEQDLLPCHPVFIGFMLPQKVRDCCPAPAMQMTQKNMPFPSSWKKKKAKQSNNLGCFDGKQMDRFGLTFKSEAKLLLQ